VIIFTKNELVRVSKNENGGHSICQPPGLSGNLDLELFREKLVKLLRMSPYLVKSKLLDWPLERPEQSPSSQNVCADYRTENARV
jgi:hypothetical protein